MANKQKKYYDRAKKGTKKNPVGGPDPRGRNVGSKKGRLAEQRQSRESYGKIANQNRDDRAADTRGITKIGKY